MAPPVLRHRLIPTFNAEAAGLNAEALVSRLLQTLRAGGSGQRPAR